VNKTVDFYSFIELLLFRTVFWRFLEKIEYDLSIVIVRFAISENMLKVVTAR